MQVARVRDVACRNSTSESPSRPLGVVISARVGQTTCCYVSTANRGTSQLVSEHCTVRTIWASPPTACTVETRLRLDSHQHHYRQRFSALGQCVDVTRSLDQRKTTRLSSTWTTLYDAGHKDIGINGRSTPFAFWDLCPIIASAFSTQGSLPGQ